MQNSVELLTSELEKIKGIQQNQWNEWEERIKELEASIQLLSGKPSSEIPTDRYEDEKHDYIKNTEDGI